MAPEPNDNPNANIVPSPASPTLKNNNYDIDFLNPCGCAFHSGSDSPWQDEKDYDSETDLDDYCTHGTPIGVCDYDHDKELNDHDEHDDYNYYDEEIDGLPPRFVSREERLANDKEYWE